MMEEIERLRASIDTSQDSSELYETDEFRIYCYKVLPCSKRAAHEWTTCPWAHPGEKARRRDPCVYSYLAIPCQETKEGNECPRGDDCPNCHSLFEYWLHPSRYRTQLCRNNDGSRCKRQICFFAHNVEELRVPDHSHLNIPEELKQARSSKEFNTETSNHMVVAADTPETTHGSQAASVTAAAIPHSDEKRHSSEHSANSAPLRLHGLPPTLPMGASAATRRGSLEVLEFTRGCMSQPTPAPTAAAIGARLNGIGSPNGLQQLGSTNQAVVAANWLLQQQQQQQQQQSGILDSSWYSAQVTPAAAAAAACQAAYLSAAAAVPGRLSFDTAAHTSSSSRRSLEATRPPAPLPAASGSLWPTSTLFSSSMAADPQVPEPQSPHTAAKQAQQRLLLQKQQLQALQSYQQEQLDAAAYEQQLQLMLALQRQAASRADSQRASSMEYTMSGTGSRGSSLDYGVGGSHRGSYVDYMANAAAAGHRGSYMEYMCGTTSPPPISPGTYSLMSSRSSGVPEDYQSVSSYPSPFPAPVPTLTLSQLSRALSGPIEYGQLPYTPLDVSQRSSMDAGYAYPAGAPANPLLAATNGAAAAAQQAAGVRAEFDLLSQTPLVMSGAAAGSQLMPSGGHNIAQYTAALQGGGQHAGAGGKLNLETVAELVECVNRGELGDSSGGVMSGVISMLMQQLQQQQLAA